MGLRSDSGYISVLAASAVNTTYSVTGLDFTPSIVFLFGPTRQLNAYGLDTSFAWNFGIALSSSSRTCVATMARDASTAQQCGQGVYTSYCYVNLDDETLSGALDFVSMDEDGFTVIVDDQFSHDTRVSYLAVGDLGSDLTDLYIGTTTEPGATGDQTVSGVGFTPKALIFLMHGNRTTIDTSASADITAGLGFATGASNQFVACGWVNDGADPSDTTSIVDPAACISRDKTKTALANLKEFNSDGFVLTWTARDTTGVIYPFLAIGGSVSLEVDCGVLPLEDDTDDHTVTPGFNVAAILTSGAPNDGVDGLQAHAQFGTGVVDDDCDTITNSMRGRDNVNTGDYDCNYNVDAVYTEINASAQTKDCEMDITALSATDGFTYKMNTARASALANAVGYLLLGPYGTVNYMSLAGALTFNGGDSTDRDNLVLQTNKIFAGALTLAGTVIAKLYRRIQGYLRGIPNPAANIRGYPNPSSTQEGYPDPTGNIEGGRKR